MSPWWTVGLPALAAALTAWRLSDLLTSPDEPPPALAGGLALALAVVVGGLTAAWAGALHEQAPPILLAGMVVFLAGASRDVGRGVRYQSGAALFLAAVIVVAVGVRFEAVKLPFATGAEAFLELGGLAPVVTLLWLVGIAWLVRAADPLPGLTPGLGAIAAATFLLAALARGGDHPLAVDSLAAPLGAVVLGACAALAGPGRGLSLGRGGSGLLGFLLAVLSVVGALKHTAFLLIALPLLALAVPALDLAYRRRQWRRAGQVDPGTLDRARSLPEMLQRRGFTHRRSVALLLGLQAYCSLVALALVGLITVPAVVKLLLLACLLPLGLGAFLLLTRIAARVAVVQPGRIELLGLPLDALDHETALARLDELIRAGGSHHVFTADVSGLMRAREEPELAEIIRTCDVVTADGTGVLWAARLFDLPLPERVSGVDLVRSLCGLAAARGYGVFLLGAAPGVAEEAGRILGAENPGLRLVGVRDGYFDDEAAVVEQLRTARPEILFVALGIPRQERFIRRWYRELELPLCIGVGGSFDVISGRLERAPRWMQVAGLEWLFRVIQEPKRLPRLLALPKFVLLIAGTSLARWRRGEGEGD